MEEKRRSKTHNIQEKFFTIRKIFTTSTFFWLNLTCLNIIQDGPFRGYSWMGGEGGVKKAPYLKPVARPAIMKLVTVIPYT